MVNYRNNDPESQQPFQTVNHQYGSSINNTNSYYATQEQHRHNHHHNYGRNNNFCLHFVQIVLQVLHIVTPFLLLFATDGISEYVSNCAWYLATFGMVFFWAYGGLGFIVHIAEVICRCCRDAPRDYNAIRTSLVWHYIKFISHLLVTLVFAVWTIIAAPEWLSDELGTNNRWVVVIAVLQTIWAAISAILEFVLIRRVRAYKRHLEEEVTSTAQQQRELPTTTSAYHTTNPYGSY